MKIDVTTTPAADLARAGDNLYRVRAFRQAAMAVLAMPEPITTASSTAAASTQRMSTTSRSSASSSSFFTPASRPPPSLLTQQTPAPAPPASPFSSLRVHVPRYVSVRP